MFLFEYKGHRRFLHRWDEHGDEWRYVEWWISVLRRLRGGGYSSLTCLTALVALLVLSGCQHSAPHLIVDEESRLPGVVTGVSDRMILSMEKRLKNQGVRIISRGENYLVSVPAKALFAEQSPRLTWASFQLLNEIACYLRQFRKVGVQVSGYTSPYSSLRREKALSLARADAVANYLWSQGIDTRFIFSHGLGSEKPIFVKAPQGDDSPNARIEITFRHSVT